MILFNYHIISYSIPKWKMQNLVGCRFKLMSENDKHLSNKCIKIIVFVTTVYPGVKNSLFVFKPFPIPFWMKSSASSTSLPTPVLWPITKKQICVCTVTPEIIDHGCKVNEKICKSSFGEIICQTYNNHEVTLLFFLFQEMWFYFTAGYFLINTIFNSLFNISLCQKEDEHPPPLNRFPSCAFIVL